jgi:cell division protein FtsW
LNILKTYYNLKGDRSVWLIVALLEFVFSSDCLQYIRKSGYKYNTSHGTEYYLIRQLVFIGYRFVIGVYTAYRLHYMVSMPKLAPILMVIAVPLLVYTALFGTEMNDASRWIKIPILELSFQTSDFAKVLP